jgi:hypothetical protein
MRIELAACEATILGEIADPKFKRAQVATTYALCLRSSERDRIDWGKVNRAILDRWSPAALKWIKERAWKIAEGRG